ncbi:MarR family winged helix-turn-helix transcriptional regulator [Paenarthrobacter ilicis]|uniref:DNA-binding MarR family transcriptional regulator n=1 Tax=Paenarthrobacter ilicis TaxID=43665 RepID=A0ABX0TK26_9MICC|nr:MarR family transcriptional regulator [Paenarthrobacter ilicis]MBM7794869.1 DNA-binding MarR family transcriptional regulator [Paenarthrobacter ilicis]NIJ02832.1 DNA-binding MarR family transcriptional regulator [Paenarthrobacter ilicis]
MTSQAERQGYWYRLESRKQMGAVDVLNALRDYRSAEAEMRRRTRASMGMGETDLAALRYLLEAKRGGREVGPKELAVNLGITSASMTSLVDRLVRSGFVTREPHPTDRRALILKPTSGSEQEVRSTLGDMHSRMMEVAETLDGDDAAVVVDFLRRMRKAIDSVGAP